MLWMLLVACEGPNGPLTVKAGEWTDAWSTHLVYQSVEPATLSAGGSDTAAIPVDRLDVTIATTDTERAFAVRALDDAGVGETLRELTFSTAKGLAVTHLDGVALDPEVVLLPANWEEGGSVTSGDYVATTDAIEDAATWYGSFRNVATVRVEGPTGSALSGVLRIAPKIGPVQFSLGGVAGDLVWYDPTGTGD